jgi:hypothetical protein
VDGVQQFLTTLRGRAGLLVEATGASPSIEGKPFVWENSMEVDVLLLQSGLKLFQVLSLLLFMAYAVGCATLQFFTSFS